MFYCLCQVNLAKHVLIILHYHEIALLFHYVDLPFLIFLNMLQVMYLQAFVIVLLMGKLMRKIFFGQLRAAEMEVSI